MPQYKLTKAELAALDLLIAQMQEEKAAVAGPEFVYTPVLARVARTLLTATRRRAITPTITPTITPVTATPMTATPAITGHVTLTPAVADFPAGSRNLGDLAVEAAAADVLPNLSLDELIQIRKQVVTAREQPAPVTAAKRSKAKKR